MSHYSELELNNIIEEAMSSLFPSISSGTEFVTGVDSQNENSMPETLTTTDISNTPINSIQIWSDLVEDYQRNIRQYQLNMRTILTISNSIMIDPPRIEAYIDIPIYTRRNVDISNVRQNRMDLTPSTIPTPLQMFQQTEVFTYSENNGLNNPICPISLEPFQEGELIYRIKHCNHNFKQIELIRWFSCNSQCPVCRYDICLQP